MIYAIVIFIIIIFLIAAITYITCLAWNYSVVASPLQTEHNAETVIDNATLSTWPTLTYAEAKSRDPRAVNAICCPICLVDYEEEEGEDKALRFLPECGHLFHAACVEPWLWRRQTCPVCQSLVMNQDMQTSLAEKTEQPKQGSLALTLTLLLYFSKLHGFSSLSSSFNLMWKSLSMLICRTTLPYGYPFTPLCSILPLLI
ncbi:hypothetical protein IEQ34_021112 [Dendrobium chrysotoxum]|uniref:RING-type domain-containing protein n=1 Tax=Dendrobium chrysotoxum TaxID=161865 RepID=A0AAV7FKZ3_DENCH|nr:hypothetical protein IEQ34_021112 [Dendrobium chrysotoxum]